MSEDSKGSNIIVANTQDLWDYKADPAYADAVAKTTEYVSGAIDIIALIAYFSGKSAVALFHWLNESGTQAIALGRQANEFYYEKGLNEKVDRLVDAIKGKIDDLQESQSVHALDDDSIAPEDDSPSGSGEGEQSEMAA